MLPRLESILQSFSTSASKFRIVETINPTTAQPKTLYILDSSYNPPSIAHFTLAVSALNHHALSEAGPYRLLLLFSTHNADKAPQPIEYTQRIVLMIAFAEDLSRRLKNVDRLREADAGDISIDIGLTKEPYYGDKSAAITANSPPMYLPHPIHVHLIGFDTFIRLCNPKYYPQHNPPLSALKPYFEAGHKILVTKRPSDASDQSSQAYGSTQTQEKYLQDLRSGVYAQEGFQPAWADAIVMAEANEGVGVSSTRVRKAAEEGDWALVNSLCTKGVAEWITDQSLYGKTKTT